jgi:hypothetical protein
MEAHQTIESWNSTIFSSQATSKVKYGDAKRWRKLINQFIDLLALKI